MMCAGDKPPAREAAQGLSHKPLRCLHGSQDSTFLDLQHEHSCSHRPKLHHVLHARLLKKDKKDLTTVSYSRYHHSGLTPTFRRILPRTA